MHFANSMVNLTFVQRKKLKEKFLTKKDSKEKKSIIFLSKKILMLKENGVKNNKIVHIFRF